MDVSLMDWLTSPLEMDGCAGICARCHCCHGYSSPILAFVNDYGCLVVIAVQVFYVLTQRFGARVAEVATIKYRSYIAFVPIFPGIYSTRLPVYLP